MRLFCLPLFLLLTSFASAKSPNIIYILADDLGYGDLACYGGKVIQTPRIDRMRAEGLKLTQHYSGSCMCAPTRSSLLTGFHTGHGRIRNNGSHLRPPGKGQPTLLLEDVTMAEVLKQAGYATGVIGKWGCGDEGSTGVPNDQGFDHWFGYLDQTDAHHYYPPFLSRNREKVLYPDNPEKRTHYSHDLFTQEGIEFIKQHQKGSPFFLYMAYTIPHVDLDVPDDSKKPYIGSIEETEPYGTPGGQHYRHEPRPHATFAGMVSRLDRDVGKMLDLLDELGIAKDTLVIFSSDNGPTSAGGADPKFFDGNGPLRGIKFELYEGGIRCPFIAWWPGTITPGTESAHISAHWDMLPTFAELAGVKPPAGLDGISMAPLLTGHADEQKTHANLYWEAYNNGGQQAVRRGPWKAVRTGILKNPVKPLEIYNLDADLAETTDVSAKHPEIAAEMLQLMQTSHTPNEHYDWKSAPPKSGKKNNG
ncbi:MAG TPA: arylsulfatase [Prosthecobacter sp.]|nr:arylsulfatase [Prosthecobacter sp.]